MAKYTVTRIEHFPTYFTVTLRPVRSSRQLDFLPGQYATISFKTDGRWSPVRCFSMTSSPGSQELQFATRLTGNFTARLADLPVGTEISVQGPYGSFNIDPEFDRRIVMMAGGIGITPFMSMLRHAAETKLRNPITLLYACRSIQDIPFREEIERLQQRNPYLKVAFLIADGETDKSRGIFRRRIDDSMLEEVTGGHFESYTFFVCGPEGFTASVSDMLREREVDTDRLVIESFTQTTHLGLGVKLSIPSLTYATTGLALLAGIGFFMAIDLARYVPKVEATAAPTSAQNSQAASDSNSTTDTSSSSASNQSSSNAGSSGSDTSSSTNTSYSSPNTTQTQTYQAPVTTVS